MNKLIKLSVATSLALTSLYAAENFSEIFTESHPSGEFRGIYQSNSQHAYADGVIGSSSTSVLGGKVELATDRFRGFDAVFTGYGTMSVGDNRNKTDGDYLNNGKDNGDYALLGQAFLRYTNNDNFLQAGRFELDTPLLHSDDVRMVPDLFQGIYGAVVPFEDVRVEAGYIDRMAGWENGGDNAKFEKMGTLIDGMNVLNGYVTNQSAISFVGVSYADEKAPFSMRIFDYITKNVMNQVYLDTGVTSGMFYVQAQYLRSIADNQLKDFTNADVIDSTVWGVRAAVTIEDTNIGLSIAYNESNKMENALNKGGTVDFFGGANDPLYTSMDVSTEHQLGGAKAYKAEATYDYSEALNMGLAYAIFKKEDGFNNKETDLSVTYALKENIDLKGMISKIIETDVFGEETTNDRARLAVAIKF
ncbi:MAG: OprD family outer membrane porin [Sulfurimonas sp.]